MYKTFSLLVILLSIAFTGLHSQETNNTSSGRRQSYLPSLAVKTNLLYDATTTFNLGGEVKLSDYLTLDLSVNYNPWSFSENKKFKHVLVQPELRYWIYEPFNGHYLGTHLMYSYYNVGNINLPLDIFSDLKNFRYQGNGYGFGFSYGYQWILSAKWNLEATFGFGYIYFDYSRYECQSCGKKLEDSHKNYFGPTKAGLSLIYILQ